VRVCAVNRQSRKHGRDGGTRSLSRCHGPKAPGILATPSVECGAAGGAGTSLAVQQNAACRHRSEAGGGTLCTWINRAQEITEIRICWAGETSELFFCAKRMSQAAGKASRLGSQRKARWEPLPAKMSQCSDHGLSSWEQYGGERFSPARQGQPALPLDLHIGVCDNQ